nr:putative dolichyl-diphosphooligosaccharide--protein glycosyltransferase subunit 3b [Quercus suber]
MDQGDFSRLAESMADFVQAKTKLNVGLIHRPLFLSTRQLGFNVVATLFWIPFAIKKIVKGKTLLHDPKLWLTGLVFDYFFSFLFGFGFRERDGGRWVRLGLLGSRVCGWLVVVSDWACRLLMVVSERICRRLQFIAIFVKQSHCLDSKKLAMNTARLFDDAIFGNIDSFNREVSDGALISLEHKTPSRNCILHVAAKFGQRQIMERVLDSLYPHSPLHETNCKGNTALHIAASLGYLDVSGLLITRAIDQEAEVKRLLLKAQNVEQNTALHLAVKHDFVRDILIRFPNAILKADDFGRTPLHYAAYFDSLEVVNLFLENNNTSLAYKLDKQGMSALHISAKKGHCDVMSAILQNFPFTCELLDNKGRTALHLRWRVEVQMR